MLPAVSLPLVFRIDLPQPAKCEQVLQYIELGLSVSFPFHSLRIKFEPSQDSMMIDRQTCGSLEVIQNLQRPNSKDCLYGLMNQTLTPMGARRLRVNLLQPSTNATVLKHRYEAVEELSTKEHIFFPVRKGALHAMR